MNREKFNKLSKEERQQEIEKCSSLEYFYNNYYKRDGMPDFSQEAWGKYLENSRKSVFVIDRVIGNLFYPFTPEECFKK